MTRVPQRQCVTEYVHANVILMVNINVRRLCTFYWFGNFMVMFLCFSNKFTLTSQAKLTVTSNPINVTDKF